MSITLPGATNQSVAVSGQSVDTTVGATGQSSQAIPAESAPDVSNSISAGVTAPAAAPHGGAHTDAAANQNTVNFYAKEQASLKLIEEAVNGSLLVSNAVDTTNPDTRTISVKAHNVRLAPSDGRVYAQAISLDGDTGEYKEPVQIMFDAPNLDYADPDAAKGAILEQLARIPGIAEIFDTTNKQHTLGAFNVILANLFKEFAQSDANPQGFKPKDIETIQKMAILQKNKSKLDTAHAPYIWGDKKMSSLTMDFTFGSLDVQHVSDAKTNIEARGDGIKDYFIATLINKGVITSTNADKALAEQEIAAKAARIKSDLRLLVENMPDSTPPQLKVFFGLPKDPLKEVTSANDFSEEALSALSDKKELMQDALANALAFGQQAGITNPKHNWTEIFGMFGPEQLRHFVEDRIKGMAPALEKTSPELHAKLNADVKAFLAEPFISTWKDMREAHAKRTKPEINISISDHGVSVDPSNPSNVIARPAQVTLNLPIPDGLERNKLWNLIADGRPLASLPQKTETSLLDGDITPPTPAAGTATPQNTSPIAAGQTNDGTNTTLAQGNTNTGSAPIAENSTGLMNAGVPTSPISSTTAANPSAMLPQPQGFAAGMVPRNAGNIASGTLPVAPASLAK